MKRAMEAFGVAVALTMLPMVTAHAADAAGGLQGGKLGNPGGAAERFGVQARQLGRLIGPRRRGQRKPDRQP